MREFESDRNNTKRDRHFERRQKNKARLKDFWKPYADDRKGGE